jgi:hypothetical protein
MCNAGQACSGGRPVHVVDVNRTPFLNYVGKPGSFRASNLSMPTGKAPLADRHVSRFSPEAGWRDLIQSQG